MKSRKWVVKMQKDVINQVSKSGLHGSHPKMKERMMDFKKIAELGFSRPSTGEGSRNAP